MNDEVSFQKISNKDSKKSIDPQWLRRQWLANHRVSGINTFSSSRNRKCRWMQMQSSGNGAARLHLPQQNIDAVESLVIRIYGECKLSGYPLSLSPPSLVPAGEISWIFIDPVHLKTQKFRDRATTRVTIPSNSRMYQSGRVTSLNILVTSKTLFLQFEIVRVFGTNRNLICNLCRCIDKWIVLNNYRSCVKVCFTNSK